MVEAMLAGRRVIAFKRGAAPEIVDEGVTGYLVTDVGEMATAMRPARALDRRRCRVRAIKRFSASRMAAAYEHLYLEVLRQHARKATHAQAAP